MLLDTFKYTLIESSQQSLEVGITISTFIYRGRMMTVLSFYQLWVSTLWKTILLKLKMSEWPSVGKVLWSHRSNCNSNTVFPLTFPLSFRVLASSSGSSKFLQSSWGSNMAAAWETSSKNLRTKPTSHSQKAQRCFLASLWLWWLVEHFPD